MPKACYEQLELIILCEPELIVHFDNNVLVSTGGYTGKWHDFTNTQLITY